MSDYHVPVLLKETIWYLDVRPGKKYIDGTLGGGGHTGAILEAGGIVLGIDQDLEAIRYVQGNLKSQVSNLKLTLKHGNFAHLKEIASETGFTNVSGILLDLGVASHQLTADYRGFSFNLGGRLDMRMDPVTQTVTAADLVNVGGEAELAGLFSRFGEERESKKIAKAIVGARRIGKIETTDQLAKIILAVSHRSAGDRTHPATRVFQALRLAVNDEMAALDAVLPQAVELLESGGRFVAISFHSLEDRKVKQFMNINEDLRALTNKPVRPSRDEMIKNPRSRSGKLRAAEKI